MALITSNGDGSTDEKLISVRHHLSYLSCAKWATKSLEVYSDKVTSTFDKIQRTHTLLMCNE